MDLTKLHATSIKGKTTPGDRAEFVKHVNRVCHTVDVLSLVLRDQKVEPINEGCDDPELMGTPVGKKYAVELTGRFVPGQEIAGRQFAVRATFKHFGAYVDHPPQLAPPIELCLGIVPIDDAAPFDPDKGDVWLDIVRYEHIDGTGTMRPLAHFPLVWQQLVGAQVMAVTLANQ